MNYSKLFVVGTLASLALALGQDASANPSARIQVSDIKPLLTTAFSIFVVILAQSAATSRAYAAKYGDRFSENTDLVGIGFANIGAGISGTFVVNGSPTKTQMVDSAGGRSQVSALTTVAIVGIVLLFLTKPLQYMPEAVLASVVFLIGVDLVDIKGLRLIAAVRKGEFVIAVITAIVVCAVGVEQGIILAIVVSILYIIKRQYTPNDYLVGVSKDGEPTYLPPTPGTQSAPGLIIFRYDSELFYANANRFVDDVEALIGAAPDPVEWLILDASSLDDVDYSAGKALQGLLDYLEARSITPVLARVDTSLLATLQKYGIDKRIGTDHIFGNLIDAYNAFEARAQPKA